MTAREQFPPLPTGRAHHAGAVAIKRTVSAARKAGIDVAGFDALPDGTIRVFDARLAPRPATDLFEEFDAQGKL